jgi:chorismate mutase/prephenate dehydratase
MRSALLILLFASALATGVPAQGERALARPRARIDAVDARIVGLLNERARIVREIGQIKRQAGLPAADPTRVDEVLNRIASQSTGPLPEEHLRRIYRQIVAEMTAFEAAEMTRK